MSYLKISTLALLVALTGCGGSDEEKARRFIEEGNKHLLKENSVAAKIEFTNALRLNKSSIEALFQLALLAESEKNWPQFEEHLKNLLSISSEHINARLKLTHFYMGSNQTDLAKTHSDYLLTIAPENTDIQLAQAAVLYKLKETEDARAIIINILTAQPDNVDAIFLQANDYMQDSKLEDAIELLGKGIKIHPDNLALNMSMIQALNAYGDWEGTIPVYQHLIKRYPSSAAPSASLAQTYVKQGHIAQAIEVIESFAQANSSANFYIKAVELIAATQGADISEEKLKIYISSNPNLSELRFALADIYTQTNRPDLSYKELEAIKKTAGNTKVKLQAMNRLARIDFVTGKEQKAKKTIHSILSENPEDASALALKANLLIKEKKAKEAIKILRSALRKNTESAELLLTLGRAHESEQQWELASENYANALKLSPGKPIQTIHYAEFLVKRGNLDKAKGLLDPLIQSGSNNSSALRMYTQIMLSKQNWGAVLEAAERLKTSVGDTPEVALAQGLAHEGQKNTKSAIESFKHLYKLAPDSAKAQALLVKTYINNDKRIEAEKIIAQALNKDDKNFSALLLKGNLFAHYKEWPQAIDSIKEAIASDPKKLQSHERLVQILMQTGKTKQAMTAIEKGLIESPENVTLKIYKASIFQQTGQLQKSVDTYQNILENNPELDVIANNLAVLLQNLGGGDNLKRAAKVANRFRQSKTPQFQDTLGWIYAQQGNYDEAIALLRRAAGKLPKEGEVQYHLGFTFERLEKVDLARKHLNSALKLAKEQNISAEWVLDTEKVLSKLE